MWNHNEIIKLSHKMEIVVNNKQKMLFRKAFGFFRLAYHWELLKWQEYDKYGIKKSHLKKAGHVIKKAAFPFGYEVDKYAVWQPFPNLNLTFQKIFRDLKQGKISTIIHGIIINRRIDKIYASSSVPIPQKQCKSQIRSELGLGIDFGIKSSTIKKQKRNHNVNTFKTQCFTRCRISNGNFSDRSRIFDTNRNVYPNVIGKFRLCNFTLHPT